jgi:hypothetical protein
MSGYLMSKLNLNDLYEMIFLTANCLDFYQGENKNEVFVNQLKNELAFLGVEFIDIYGVNNQLHTAKSKYAKTELLIKHIRDDLLRSGLMGILNEEKDKRPLVKIKIAPTLYVLVRD